MTPRILFADLRHLNRKFGPNAAINYLRKRDFPLEQQAHLALCTYVKRTHVVLKGRPRRKGVEAC